MHYNAILSVLAAGTSLISISAAAPLQTRQSPVPQCPAGTQYHDFETTSGFKGCTSTPAKYSSGPRVYWGNCPPNHGNWYVCSNGFKGCTTDSTVCDPKPAVGSSNARTECPWGQAYYDCAATGFKGCSADSTVCDPKSKPVVGSSNDRTECPWGQTYYDCAATGFKGCSADFTVCDPKPVVKPLTPAVVPLTPAGGSNNDQCPKGTWYKDFTSTTGFKGCTSTPEQFSTGERKYWSSCPPAHGNWYVCANGFSGCNTNVNVCGLKA